MNQLFRVVAAGAGEDRHCAVRFVREDLDDAQALGVAQRRVLSRRPARAEKVNTRVDLTAAETTDGGFVERPALGERRDECGADASECCSHRASPAGLKACATKSPERRAS
jgi:hypothetical protein